MQSKVENPGILSLGFSAYLYSYCELQMEINIGNWALFSSFE